MNTSVWYQITVTVLTAIGFVFAVLFVIDYARLSKGRWKHSEIGRLLMLGPTSLGAVMGFILTAFVLGQSLSRQIVGVVLWSSVVITLPWWHRVMRKSMQKDRRKEMTREEFVQKVMKAVEEQKLEKLDELYDRLVHGNGQLNHPEVTTRGGEATTIKWGTP